MGRFPGESQWGKLPVDSSTKQSFQAAQWVKLLLSPQETNFQQSSACEGTSSLTHPATEAPFAKKACDSGQ